MQYIFFMLSNHWQNKTYKESLKLLILCVNWFKTASNKEIIRDNRQKYLHIIFYTNFRSNYIRCSTCHLKRKMLFRTSFRDPTFVSRRFCSFQKEINQDFRYNTTGKLTEKHQLVFWRNSRKRTETNGISSAVS